MTMVNFGVYERKTAALTTLLLSFLTGTVFASLGDRLPEFTECLTVCSQVNCNGPESLSIPLGRRLLLWDCHSECDYACQHIVTDRRLAHQPPYRTPVLQFHGKWPFHRFLGIQEPFSVLFSLFNYLAHCWGLATLRQRIPATYLLRRYYIAFGYFGLNAWLWSMAFHTRDLPLTETMDYLGAGASIMYGLHYTIVRLARWDRPGNLYRSVRLAWATLCATVFGAHAAYLMFWSWDYGYNMMATIAIGTVHNLLWSVFALYRYRRLRRPWAAWPGLIIAWLMTVMSLELLDFSPWHLLIDAHCLWHLGTVLPTICWYIFLIKDAEEDLQWTRPKV